MRKHTLNDAFIGVFHTTDFKNVPTDAVVCIDEADLYLNNHMLHIGDKGEILGLCKLSDQKAFLFSATITEYNENTLKRCFEMGKPHRILDALVMSGEY